MNKDIKFIDFYIIGTAPVKVIDFKCRSYNWENLTCSFERPFNPVAVNYTLYYGIGIGKPIFRIPVSNILNICFLSLLMKQKYLIEKQDLLTCSALLL